MVAEFVLEHVHDGCERAAFIMAPQVLYVLKHEGIGLVMGDDLRSIKEQRSLRVAQETVRSTQSIFLGDACDGEGLAGKTCQKKVVRRYQ